MSGKKSGKVFTIIVLLSVTIYPNPCTNVFNDKEIFCQEAFVRKCFFKLLRAPHLQNGLMID